METIKDILKGICANILAENKYFANGFYDTVFHEEKGLLLSNIDKQYINITDVSGNYFYLGFRPKANVRLGQPLSEGKKNYQYCYDCFFVAITEGYDELVLLNAVVNNMSAIFQTINTVSTDLSTIMAEELRPLNRSVIDSTISKMNHKQAVKVTFTQCVQFQTQSCVIDPCNSCDDSTMVVADYPTFNSSEFINTLNGPDEYSYRCIYAEYNGNLLGNGSLTTYTGATKDIRLVPVQIAPNITIPAHDTLALSYDHNWIAFLQSLPIADYLDFDTSPFKDGGGLAGHPDIDYPFEQIAEHLGSEEDPVAPYGDGFQIRRKKNSTFRFDIEYGYDISSPAYTGIGHVISFTHLGCTIDGAFVNKSNTITY